MQEKNVRRSTNRSAQANRKPSKIIRRCDKFTLGILIAMAVLAVFCIYGMAITYQLGYSNGVHYATTYLG
jgi:cell division protein FtsL